MYVVATRHKLLMANYSLSYMISYNFMTAVEIKKPAIAGLIVLVGVGVGVFQSEDWGFSHLQKFFLQGLAALEPPLVHPNSITYYNLKSYTTLVEASSVGNIGSRAVTSLLRRQTGAHQTQTHK